MTGACRWRRVVSSTLRWSTSDSAEPAGRAGRSPSPVWCSSTSTTGSTSPTATNQDARWLFPGRRGGQPMTPDTIEIRLRQHDIPALRGRTAALRQLVLQAPAPVSPRCSATAPTTGPSD